MNTLAPVTRLEKLQQLHRCLESELKSLTRRGHMTPSEQLRAQVIKKEKLKAKDEISIISTAVAAE